MTQVPMYALAREVRDVVDLTHLVAPVLYFSIPALEETGKPTLEDPAHIASSKLRLQGGEVLVAKLNPRKSRVVIVPTHLDRIAVASTEFIALQPHSVDRRYLAYMLGGETVRQWLDSNVRSVTRSHQRVEPEIITQLRTHPPSLLEQRWIADFLDDQVARIDNIVAARQRQIGLRRQSISSEIDLLFGSTGSHRPSTRLGRFLAGIEQGWSPQCEAGAAGEDEWGVLKVSAIRNGQFLAGENKRPPDELEPQIAYEVRTDDLLVTRGNTPALVGAFVAVPANVRSKLMLCDKIMRLRLDESLDPRYVALVGGTTEARAHLSAAGTGTSQSMVNIRGDDIRDLAIPYRGLDEQRGAVHTAEGFQLEARQASDLFAMQAARLNELKRSLITTAVMGEFEVSSADGSRVST